MSEQEFQAKVLSELQALRADVERLQTDVHKLQGDVAKLQGDVNELATQVRNQEYKFEVYQRGTDAMVSMATTITIAAASVVVLSSLSPAITTLVSAIAHPGN
ncbi:MAG TPA: hypothetical protein IGP91_01735 [Thermosynechococcus sp. M46_R2017_013]|nr:hypothetical protein [Thermosynechococcus sp. M46_R2017_013]